ncbi:AidA/PixA family protein [Mucilaginibacter sp. L196]|uniref:AidA/PixA family protein n=1 Tax=Mucilaginibacter sp. L196 TaxID=1641870 RepID=UPI00131AD4B0|nr:AidA/PixA family protein [Mucilaginibacter sp. L196]
MDLTTKGIVLIQIATYINLDMLEMDYPDPIRDKQNATVIASGRASMTCTGSRGIVRGQKSWSLEFEAEPGDIVSFSSVITSDSRAYTASIYSLGNPSDRSIFSGEDTKKDSIELKVQSYGSTILTPSFGLYTKDVGGKPKDLIGYFYFGSGIMVRY